MTSSNKTSYRPRRSFADIFVNFVLVLLLLAAGGLAYAKFQLQKSPLQVLNTFLGRPDIVLPPPPAPVDQEPTGQANSTAPMPPVAAPISSVSTSNENSSKGFESVKAEPTPAPAPPPPLEIVSFSQKAPARVVPVKPRMGFAHPGLLHTEESFQRMRTKVQAGESPWIDSWNLLIGSRHARLDWKARPVEKAIRGNVPGQNIALLFNDVHASYQLALRWKISGEKEYAEKSIEILNAWAERLTAIEGNADRFLAAGIYGYQFANAAEIMRTYPGWRSHELRRFQDMMLKVFYVKNRQFLGTDGKPGGHNGAAITNYWANWDLCNIASMQAIGVLCDRRDIYDEAMTYFKSGGGNGALHKAIYYLHDNNLGQWQESGRDQGHTTLGIALMGPIMETAWNQGDDLYGYENNRFLAGAEYVAKYNLTQDVPFQTYAWGTGPRGDRREQTVVSSGGFPTFRHGYELVVNHYVNRLGVAAPYSLQCAARTRPEGGAGGHASSFDQFGFGTLTATLDTQEKNSAPSGLTARRRNGKITLSWWGAAGAESYQVMRSSTSGGPYTRISKDLKDCFSFTDETSPSGVCYYVVTGMRSGQETAPSNEVVISAEPRLRVHLKFDEPSGQKALNSVDRSVGAMFPKGTGRVPGRLGGALSLNGRDQFVELPRGVMSEFGDFTISTWVYASEASTWARVFDFGDQRGQSMFFTPSAGKQGLPRFEVYTVYVYNAQGIDCATPFPVKRWVHVAVTLSGRTGTIYIDGEPAGSNPSIDFPPYQLGVLNRNWIGRSQHEADPYLNGKVDDFRIYDGALNQVQIGELMATGQTH